MFDAGGVASGGLRKEMTVKTKGMMALASLALAASAVRADSSNRWLFYSRSCTTEEQLEAGRTFVDMAAKAGMNGMVIGNVDDLWRQGKHAQDCVRQLGEYGAMKGVRIIPHCWSIGYGTMGGIHPGMHETVLIKGMPYEVRGREAVPAKNTAPITNPGLAEYDIARNKFAGWSSDKAGVLSFVDVTGGHDGKPAMRFEPSNEVNPDRHSRFSQKLTLTPHRRYRFSAWVRGVDVQTHFHPIKVVAIVETEPGKTQEAGSRGLPLDRGDCDWHKMTIEFTTGATGLTYLYAGSWNADGGQFWVSDFSLEEIGITEISRRKGAPRRLRNAERDVVYKEGRDWTLIETKRGEEVRLAIPAGSRIRPGDKLLFDCFIISHGGPKSIVSSCMSDPRLYECFELSARGIEDALHPAMWLLSIDEVMNGGTCELCKVRHTDMAHIFGECVTKMRNVIKGVNPRAEIFAWSDMFDPNHNARANVGSCKGTFDGVADLIPKDVGMMLWYGAKLDKSAPYFAERGHSFMGSICCDGNNCAEAVRMWKEKLTSYPELRGFMYTTWLKDYSKLDVFMNGLK